MTRTRTLVRTLVACSLLAVTWAAAGCGSASELPSDGASAQAPNCDKLAVPQFCMRCSDGTTSCPSYVVVNGECTLTVCGM